MANYILVGQTILSLELINIIKDWLLIQNAERLLSWYITKHVDQSKTQLDEKKH